MFLRRIVEKARGAPLKVAVAVGVILFLSAFLISRHKPPEPLYMGKPASYWVQEAISRPPGTNTLDALRTLGPLAILPLLDAMQIRHWGEGPLRDRLYDKLPWKWRQHFNSSGAESQIRERACMVLNRISDSVGPSDAPVLLPRLVPLLVEFDERPSESTMDAGSRAKIPFGVSVRSLTTDMLANLGANAAPAVPTLIRALGDDKWIRYNSTSVPYTLGRIGPSAKRAIPALKALLQKGPSNRLSSVLEAIWLIDPPEAEFGIPLLEAALKSTEPYESFSAARQLWKMTGDNSQSLPVLLSLLRANDSPWRLHTLRALGEFGPAARSALPAIKMLTEDPSDEIAEAALETLAKIDPGTHRN
ncbi:MAG: repeat-containing protein [Verrucomicrobiales bacterium]|nr:repeat-containing protein [Verrucomicrobiales bacterium]